MTVATLVVANGALQALPAQAAAKHKTYQHSHVVMTAKANNHMTRSNRNNNDVVPHHFADDVDSENNFNRRNANKNNYSPMVVVEAPSARANIVGSQFTLQGNVGYMYNFSSRWNIDGRNIKGADNHAVAYGGSLGYTHRSGFGLSADYLGFNNKWTGDNTRYDASFHALTLTPSYRFALDKNAHWGLRFGLGVGLTLSDLTWGAVAGSANGLSDGLSIGGRVADGALYTRFNNLTEIQAFGCSGKTAEVIYDSTGFGGRNRNQCVRAHDGSKAADINDSKIAQWFAKDDKARLGNPSTPNGHSAVGYDVWSLLLKGADGDKNALRILSADLAIGITEAQAKRGLKQLLGGYDGKTRPQSLQAYDDEAVHSRIYRATHSATALGLTDEESARLRHAGIVFGAANTTNTTNGTPSATNAGVAKDDLGLVLVPQVTLEYDDGVFHGGLNVRYLHALKNVKYDGTGDVAGKTYTAMAGPVGLFVGIGAGLNF